MQLAIKLHGQSSFIVISFLFSYLFIHPAAFSGEQFIPNIVDEKLPLHYAIVITQDRTLQGACRSIFMKDHLLREAYARAVSAESDPEVRVLKSAVLADIENRVKINEQVPFVKSSILRTICKHGIGGLHAHTVMFNADNTLQTISPDGVMSRWDVQTGECIKEEFLATHEGYRLISANRDYTRFVFLAPNKIIVRNKHEVLFRLELAQESGFLSAALNYDGSKLAVGNDCGPPHIWDLSKKPIVGYRIKDTSVPYATYALAFNHDDSKLIVGTSFGAYLSDMQGCRDPDWLNNFENIVAVAFDRSGKAAAMGIDAAFTYTKSRLAFRDMKMRNVFNNILTHHDFRSIDFSPDGSMVAIAFKDGGIEVWLVHHVFLLAELSKGRAEELSQALKKRIIQGDLYDELVKKMPCLQDIRIGFKVKRELSLI